MDRLLTERYPHEALMERRVVDLRAIAREYRLIGYSALRKAELVATLYRHFQHLDDAAAGRAREREDEQPGRRASTTPAAPASQPPAAAEPAPPRVDDPGAMRDPSWYAPPLPEAYDVDRLTLMVRDPRWLFCYWELRPDTLAGARAEFPGPSWTVLRVQQLHDDDSVVDDWSITVHDEALSWYIEAGRPGARFRVELGLTDVTGRYRLLVASNTVRAPQDAPSQRWDEEWVGVSREAWERLQWQQGPTPGSLGGWDVFRQELARVGAQRVGASERLSAAAPASKAGSRS
ncbi:DUF4912 domain-containing protein [bacterium]|nr:DUF4912 domain-containing protein [bacterium]